MASAQRNRKSGGQNPLQAEALGLSIPPSVADTSSPPGSQRGSQIRMPSMQAVSIPQSQSQSQSTLPQQPPFHKYYASPPSPSHTAQSQSPPTSTISPSGFSTHSGGMSNQGQTGSFPRRIPPPVTDSWVPDADMLGDLMGGGERMPDQWTRPGSGTLIEPIRTSPGPRSRVPANRSQPPRASGTSSSPVLQSMSTLRQQQYPPVGPQAPQQTQMQAQMQAQTSRMTPPALYGNHSSQSIPTVNRPSLPESNSMPLLTPPNSIHQGIDHLDDDAPLRHATSPPYHPHPPFAETHPDRQNSSNNQPSPTTTNEYSHPFQYDQDTQSEYTTEHEIDISDAEPAVASVRGLQAQMHKATIQSTVPTQSRGTHRSLPFQEEPEEADLDDVTPSGLLPHHQEPPRWTVPPQQPPQQQPPQQQQGPRSQGRQSATPPPHSPSPHPPIPLFSPQSISGATAPLLGQREHSPPAKAPNTLLVNHGNIHDHDEPAEASSDNFTPKSPNAPLPLQDPSDNYGRYRGRPNQMDALAYQHQSFASYMGGMPQPRGPTQIPQSYVSLTGAAASLNGDNNGGNGGLHGELWDEYIDFYNYNQQRNNGNMNMRPTAPVPPTPQSAVNPSHTPAFDPYQGRPFDPPLIPERYIPSALSSYLSSPMMHNPFLPRLPPPQSIVSSPSHQPLDFIPGPMNVRRNGRQLVKKKKAIKSKLGPSQSASPTQALTTNRVESTVPKDTSSENETETEDDSGRTKRRVVTKDRAGQDSEDEEDSEDEDVWLSESSEDEMDSEFHSRYIPNPSKRKRKWEQKWEAMRRLFQELDRTTDSPMILLASPSTSSTPQTHILISRAISRDPGRYMAHAQTCRVAFNKITKGRRREKAEQAALERARRAQGFEAQLAQAAFLGSRFDDVASGSSGSPKSRGAGQPSGLTELRDLPQLAAKGEEGLKVALGVALESLKQMHLIYEQREERRREEAERQRQETAGFDYLWRAAQTLNAAEKASNSVGSDKNSNGSPQSNPPKSKSP